MEDGDDRHPPARDGLSGRRQARHGVTGLTRGRPVAPRRQTPLVTGQLELPLEVAAESEDEPTRLGPEASFFAGLVAGLFFLFLAALYSLYRLRAA